MGTSLRTIYGLLAVSLSALVLGIVLIVASTWNALQPAADTPAASVRQIMQGIVVPAANAVYNAVSTTITEKGTDNVFPRTDREWEVVGSNAMALAEAASLLKVDGRAKDRSDWMRMSDAMRTAAMQSYRAAQRKDVDALLASGEVLNNSCDSCHRNYDIPIE